MGKITAELVGNSIVVTKYESNGFIIPDKIRQERRIVSIINSSLDSDVQDYAVQSDKVVVVSRGEFIYKLLVESGEDSKERYLKYCKGLYSQNDMKKGITWAEAAYLIYYVGGLAKTLDWSSIKPEEGYKICVVQEIISDKKYINERLSAYKNRLDMEYYIKSIVNGSRYIPLPLYCSFKDLVNSGICTLDSRSMFKKMTDSEFNAIFN